LSLLARELTAFTPSSTDSGATTTDRAATSEDQIIVSGVGKSYPASPAPVLDGIDLEIAAGSFFTIIGPSGAGKSTLLRVLAGLTPPTKGSVSVFGEPPSQASRAKHLGWVPQSPALLPWRTVLDNVRLPLQVNKKTATNPMDPDRLLSVLGLAGAKRMLPSQLSGGMRQRVALARAFAFRPRLLLMDEPFGALDEMTREHVGHLLLELWQEERRTVVFVTHSVAEAVVLSDRVAVMGGGKLGPAVDITLPRPRPEGIEDTEHFQQLCTRLRSQLRTAYAST
jgi:NitT/TauT family transport system ATP-binding protein